MIMDINKSASRRQVAGSGLDCGIWLSYPTCTPQFNRDAEKPLFDCRPGDRFSLVIRLLHSPLEAWPRYSIKSMEEARQYLSHPVLGKS